MRQLLCTALAVVLVAAAPAAAQPPEQVRCLIGFAHAPGPEEEALVQSHGGRIIYSYHLVDAMAVSVPETALEGLSNNPHVTVLEMDGLVQAIDAELDNTWGVQRIGAGSVHLDGNKGAGVTVAIVDTGIDYTHPDLDTNYVGGFDFVDADNDPMDDHGHGTHVAGTVAAKDDDTGVVGVAPEATLYALKVLNDSGSGYWSDIVAAIEWTVDNGIQVTNNSYGGSTDPGSLVRNAFDTAYAAGVLHVAAAGNSGNCTGTGDTVGYPAKFDSVIAVAATDANDGRACFSSTGPAVEMAAPGVSIRSTRRGGGYTSMNGTSMASPHVAGTAALVLASGAMTHTDVRAKLDETAEDLGDPGQDSHYGHGLVNAAAAAVPGPINQPPAVTIMSPLDGATFEPNIMITFQGTADDPEDGDLASALEWTSDIDGPIGTGGRVDTYLSEGLHSVTARAMDSSGRAGSNVVSVTVSSPPGTLRIDSVTPTTQGGKNADKHLMITIALRDGLDNAVEGASLTATLQHVQSRSVWEEAGTSRADGAVRLSVKNAPTGDYTLTVLNVTAAGLEWDGSSRSTSFSK